MEDIASVARPSANFHPSVWGDFFLQYASDTMGTIMEEEEQELKRLKEEVKMMFKEAPDESLLKLELIDNIQRLGVAYQFEEEIEASLLHIHNSYEEYILDEANNDLHTISLRFRLVRQHGYHVSTKAFNKFLDTEGKFKASLASDVKGMLNLFEAANYRVHEENILDEALSFSTKNLELIANRSNDHFMVEKINQALKSPFHKTLTRIGSRKYISVYQQDKSHDELLLNFAKLDFNRVQRLHQKELSVFTLWWKKLDWATNFHFARDRSAELYFWILGVYFEPQYCLARKFLTKLIAMNSLMDDIYDAHGTIDELLLLTDAIQRWDINAIDHLPPYQKHFYRVLVDVFADMEEELATKDWSERVQYAKAEMKKLARAYYQEAYWCRTKYVPTLEEHMKTTVITGAYMFLATCSYMGMGDMVTKEVLDWASSEPLMARSASTISRLMDDVIGHEFEQKRQHVASTVECYMKQHGASKEEAIEVLQKLVTNAWKDLNQECLRPTAVPLVVLERAFNLARVIYILYTGDDSYTHSKNKTKQLITSVLVEPITL